MLKTGEELDFIQDNVPPHINKASMEDFHQRKVNPISLPAYSPDLNPIEMVWNWMKDWIQDSCEDTPSSYDALRQAVQEAWESVPAEFLQGQVNVMPVKCAAVVAANGLRTRY